ncbi:hypothetical protein QL093DRAFT_1456893 [Fusarium oxysporum]|nr:hypothetical protein QL093DRAFT_1456893 [Fusarium oxysporum]
MEGLGVAANIIAVVDLSVKVIGWCAQYAQDIKNAENDKARLSQEVTHLNVASQNARDLLEGSQSTRLKASKALSLAVEESKSQLLQLEELLSAGRETRVSGRTSFHALIHCRRLRATAMGSSG